MEEFELFLSMSDTQKKQCINCGSDNVEKLISGGGAVIIKGTKTPCRQTGQRKKVEKTKEIPFYRSSEDGKIRNDILKNPDKYINTGEV